MEIIGKIITFVMSTFSNLVGSSSLIDDIKKGFKENLKKIVSNTPISRSVGGFWFEDDKFYKDYTDYLYWNASKVLKKFT